MKHQARHRFFYRFLYIFVAPFLKLAWRYSCQVAEKTDGPAIVVANHVTDLDPVLVGMSFPRQLYFVASEHVGRWGLGSRLIRFVFAPIMRVKGKTDARGGMEILRAVRGGARVCLFAEGNRSFSGVTGPIYPATGKLVLAAKAPLITYRIEGGYFVYPRWGGKTRKGPIYGHPVGRYEPEELKKMTADEVNALIARDIHEDAYARQAENPRAYRSKALAEHLETALYLCPACGGLGTLRSAGDAFSCPCGLSGSYDEYGTLAGEGLRFTTVRDWFFWQQGQLPALLAAAGDGPICADEAQRLYAVEPGVGASLLAEGPMALYRGRLDCAGRSFPLADIAELAITGQMTLTFAAAGGHYEIKSGHPRSAVKYQHLWQLLVEEKKQHPRA